MGLHETIHETADMAVVPIDWPTFHASLKEAEAGPAFAERRRTVDLGKDTVVSVTLVERAKTADMQEHDFETVVWFGAARLDVRAPWQLVQALVDARGIEQDCDILPAAILSLVAENLLSSVAKPLEHALGGTCYIWPDAHQEDADAHLCMFVVMGGQSHSIAIETDADTAAKLVKLFPPASPLPPLAVPGAMAMAVTLCAPSIAMSAYDLAQFGAGDVMLPDAGWPIFQTGTVVCDGQPLAEVAFRSDACAPTVSRLISPTHVPRSNDMTATDTTPRAPSTLPNPRQGEASAHAALESVSVTVSVELDRSEMPLGDLRQLTVGTVLPFDSALGEHVTLLANGAPFAKGELVRIGERMGVRLSALD